MNPPIVVHKKDLKAVPIHPGARVSRILTKETINSDKLLAGIGESDPGQAPHPWHRHTRDVLPMVEYVYPKGFVEVYYILSGSATVQWKTPDGKLHEEPAAEGDTIFFPEDVMEHQALNTGNGKLTIFYATVPPVKIINKK